MPWQLIFAASKQDASQLLVQATGAQLVEFLASGIWEHYGKRSEKLTEFGLPPFRRGRPRVVQPPVPGQAKGEPVNDPQP